MSADKQVFFPGYMTGTDEDILLEHGQIIMTTWDAWHFVPNAGDTTTVLNGNHYLIIKE